MNCIFIIFGMGRVLIGFFVGKSRNVSVERNGMEVGGRVCFCVLVDGSMKLFVCC